MAWTRRAFIGRAAAAAAVPAAVVAAASIGKSATQSDGKLAGGKSAGGGRNAALHPAAIAENSKKGDPNWWIKTLGAPDAILGYAGQASVRPGEPIRLYVSTTSREFRVLAFRMGWYGGDLARKVWQSGAIRGRQQSGPQVISDTNTVHARWDISLTVPTDGWPAGSYLFRLDGHSAGQRYVPVT